MNPSAKNSSFKNCSAQDPEIALVTGASSGIGLAYARELAREGYPLLIVSNEAERIVEIAREITAQYNIPVTPLCLDLATSDAAHKLHRFCLEKKMEIHILINNAGIFAFREVCSCTPEYVAKMLNLHVHTPALLCRLFGEEMASRHTGYILNMSSIAAWMAMPGIAEYAATKAFLRIFTRALHLELKSVGVNVLAVCPGAVATDLYHLKPNLQRLGIQLGILMPPEHLARKAIRKLFRGKAQLIPGGFINRLFIFLVEIAPKWLIIKLKQKFLP